MQRSLLLPLVLLMLTLLSLGEARATRIKDLADLEHLALIATEVLPAVR